MSRAGRSPGVARGRPAGSASRASGLLSAHDGVLSVILSSSCERLCARDRIACATTAAVRLLASVSVAAQAPRFSATLERPESERTVFGPCWPEHRGDRGVAQRVGRGPLARHTAGVVERGEPLEPAGGRCRVVWPAVGGAQHAEVPDACRAAAVEDLVRAARQQMGEVCREWDVATSGDRLRPLLDYLSAGRGERRSHVDRASDGIDVGDAIYKVDVSPVEAQHPLVSHAGGEAHADGDGEGALAHLVEEREEASAGLLVEVIGLMALALGGFTSLVTGLFTMSLSELAAARTCLRKRCTFETVSWQRSSKSLVSILRTIWAMTLSSSACLGRCRVICLSEER